MLRTETLSWHDPDAGDMPEPDGDVLLNVEGCGTWPGYWCSVRSNWVHADGMPVNGRVVEWSEMPQGSGVSHGIHHRHLHA